MGRGGLFSQRSTGRAARLPRSSGLKRWTRRPWSEFPLLAGVDCGKIDTRARQALRLIIIGQMAQRQFFFISFVIFVCFSKMNVNVEVPVMKGHQVRLGSNRRGGHGAGQAVLDLLLTSDTVQNLQGEPRCSGTDGTSSPSGWFTAGHLRKRTTPRNHLSWFVGELEGAQVKGEWSKGNFFLIGIWKKDS